jgi:hypothetical protein
MIAGLEFFPSLSILINEVETGFLKTKYHEQILPAKVAEED